MGRKGKWGVIHSGIPPEGGMGKMRSPTPSLCITLPEGPGCVVSVQGGDSRLKNPPLETRHGAKSDTRRWTQCQESFCS